MGAVYFCGNNNSMLTCTENIVGLHGVCGGADTESLSGYFVDDYPGITIRNAAMLNDEKTITGYKYLVDLRKRAMMRMNNDILAYINSKYRVNSIPGESWHTGEFKNNILSAGTLGQFRGIVGYKQKPECKFYKIVLTSIRLRLNYSGPVTVTINDTAGFSYSATTTVTAGVIKQLNLNKVIEGNEVQILIPSQIPAFSTSVSCGLGCGGTPINNCVRINGVSNGSLNTSEAFGVSADFICQCDLSKITCDLATNGLIGQAAFELCGAMFYDEATKTGRLNYMTIYQSEKMEAISKEAFDNYEKYLNNAFLGLRHYLTQRDGNCGCIDCSGVVIKTSI